VQGIPTFVIVDGATGETINANARGKVSSDPKGAEFPWMPKALVDMTEDGPEGINETAALCVMMEGCDAAATSAACAVLEPIAEAAKKGKEELLFFYAPKAEGPTEQIRKLTKLGAPAATPQMVLLDIPDNGGYYVSPATEVTAPTEHAQFGWQQSGVSAGLGALGALCRNPAHFSRHGSACRLGVT